MTGNCGPHVPWETGANTLEPAHVSGMAEATTAAHEDAALTVSGGPGLQQPPAEAYPSKLTGHPDEDRAQDTVTVPAATVLLGDGSEPVAEAKEPTSDSAENMPAIDSVGVTAPSATANADDDAQQPASSGSGRSLDHGLIPLPTLRCNGTHAMLPLALPLPESTGGWRLGVAAAESPPAVEVQPWPANAVRTRDPLPWAPMASDGEGAPAQVHAPSTGAANAAPADPSFHREFTAADDGNAGVLAQSADALSAEHAMATIGGLLSEDDSGSEDGNEQRTKAADCSSGLVNGHPPGGEGGPGQADGSGTTQRWPVLAERSLQELGATPLFEKTLSGSDARRAVLIPKVRLHTRGDIAVHCRMSDLSATTEAELQIIRSLPLDWTLRPKA